MEIKAKLKKPYTENERLNFIIENNHNKGYEIKETEEALEAWGFTDEKIKEQEQKREQERINNLSLTSADVERAIYEAKGIDFEDIKAMLKNQPGIDIKRIGIELRAGAFYRRHPFVDQIGALLGCSPADIDYLFENKKLPEKTAVKEAE